MDWPLGRGDPRLGAQDLAQRGRERVRIAGFPLTAVEAAVAAREDDRRCAHSIMWVLVDSER